MIDEDDDSDVESGYDFGPQPIAGIMEKRKLKPHDLVEASTEQLTHKMVSRACKGRKLSRRVQLKVRNALNTIMEANYSLKDLFTY
jgi:hypothetical protein